MKRKALAFSVLFSFIVLLFFTKCKSTKAGFPEPPSIKKFNDNQQCYRNGKLNIAERQAIYPFNIADKIQIISFNSCLGKTPIVNDTIIQLKTIENITLTSKQINDLTDILYNYNYSKKTNIITEMRSCYYPRHAIVFVNESGKVFSYIEICLQCGEIRTELPKENTGVFCAGKYDLLEELFVTIGIKYFKD